MTIVVTIAMLPVLYTVAREKSGYYIGRILWLGLSYIYSILICVVQLPWNNIHEEFNCHGNITYLCLVECFEQLFSIPITGMWYYFYFIFIAFLFLMEFLMAQIRHKHAKVKVKSMQETENSEEMEAIKNIFFVNFHQEKKLLYLYLLHFLLQVSIQVVFLCVLTFKHLPIVSQDNIHCSTNSCSTPFHCVMTYTAVKKMTIYALITMSILIIVFGTSYFIYCIYHYLVAARSASKILIY